MKLFMALPHIQQIANVCGNEVAQNNFLMIVGCSPHALNHCWITKGIRAVITIKSYSIAGSH